MKTDGDWLWYIFWAAIFGLICYMWFKFWVWGAKT